MKSQLPAILSLLSILSLSTLIHLMHLFLKVLLYSLSRSNECVPKTWNSSEKLCWWTHSCAVMRGCKTGLMKRLHDGPVPHLLDINEDLCHHIHNIVKTFLKNFVIGKLFWDLHRDFDLSGDLLKRLELLCYHIGVTFHKPPNSVATQWLWVLTSFWCLHWLFVHA